MAAFSQIFAFLLVMVWQAEALEVAVGDFKIMASRDGKVSLKVGTVDLVKARIHSITEKDKDGNMVPANASINPHKSMPMMYMLPSKASFMNASMPHHYSFKMKSNIMLKEANATLEVEVLLATNNGTVSGIPSSKKFMLMKHSVLVGIHLKKWPFCGKSGITKCMHNMTEVKGKYLDVAMKFEGVKFMKKNQSWVSKKPQDVTLEMSDKVQMDAQTPKMIANYPMLSQNMDMVTVRFEDFANDGKFKYFHLHAKQGETSGCNRMFGAGLLTLTTSFLVYMLGFLS